MKMSLSVIVASLYLLPTPALAALNASSNDLEPSAVIGMTFASGSQIAIAIPAFCTEGWKSVASEIDFIVTNQMMEPRYSPAFQALVTETGGDAFGATLTCLERYMRPVKLQDLVPQ